jgi:hypothetical protein
MTPSLVAFEWSLLTLAAVGMLFGKSGVPVLRVKESCEW